MNQQNEEKKIKEESIIEEMIKAGVHYGRAKKFTHYSIKPYLIKSNRNIELFNLKITLKKLNEAAEYLKNSLEENKKILFVGVTPASQNKIKEIAIKLNQPYMAYKWVAGLLTNFQTIQARLIYFKNLLDKESSGEINKYLPAEKAKLERELEKLKDIYSGIVDLNSLPDVLFIVNLAFSQHKTALREAKKMKIPVIALTGSDNNISKVDLFVPGNDKAPRSIAWQLDFIMSALNKNFSK